MKYSKKFIDLGRANAIIVPMAWIKSEELKHSKKMIGVYIEANETLELTPMWEDEK